MAIAKQNMRTQFNDVLYGTHNKKTTTWIKSQHNKFVMTEGIHIYFAYVPFFFPDCSQFDFFLLSLLVFILIAFAEAKEGNFRVFLYVLYSFPFQQVNSFNACQIAFFRRLDMSVLFYAIHVKINFSQNYFRLTTYQNRYGRD